MKLILTRHGETEENTAGIIQGHLPGKLTENGVGQARHVARRLSTEILDAIYSSDLARAADTANEIASFHPDTPLEFVQNLRERYLGSLEGKKRKDLLGDVINLEPEDGESIAEAHSRAKHFLHAILAKHPKETVLFVSHGFFSKCLFAAIQGVPYESVKTMEHFGNTSISIFEIAEDGSHEILCFNCTKHLQ